MYDSTTAELIRRAPPLRDLDRNSLPDRFAEAFARIAAMRVRLRSGEESDEDLEETRRFAKRLAQTNEALVALSPERDDRRSAAFVAGTAYQLVHQIDVLSDDAPHETSLGLAAITADISAMLLFLIAEASADANEVSLRVRISGDNLEREVLRTLIELAQGRVVRIVERQLVRPDRVVRSATDALYHLILRGVRRLASALAGNESTDDATAILRQAQRLACQASADPGRPAGFDAQPVIGAGQPAVFPGPYHLASLLLPVVDALAEGAVVRVPPPGNVDRNRWRMLVAEFAKERPYLWPNQRKAISQGYLDAGVSSVVGLPTGAGKSAVFQLKIGAALLARRRVLFLAPTHALVDQTRRDLDRVIPDVRVFGEPSDELLPVGTEDVLVMTPEACLYLQHMEPDILRDIGLLVFDECHLVHPKSDTDRRAIDAMLCVVNSVRLAPDADLLLLSAMLKNTSELSAWLAELTGRRALAFDMAWKPTRQLRGCVVYDADRIEELQQMLVRERQRTRSRSVPAAVKRRLGLTPYGLFSVKQTWASVDRSDYALLRLCSEAHELGTNARWRLTPNAGAASVTVASAAAEAGVTTLVFSQSIRMAVSIAERVAGSLGRTAIALDESEKRWAAAAADELGGQGQLYVDIEDDVVVAGATAHHGLLLAEERRLIESLYQRSDGLKVLSATSTLGQGINTPSELVIIAEDSRFNEDTGRRELLEPRELLNAAVRAGRAGRGTTGIVLVIPGEVVRFDDREARIGRRWTRLREVFGQSDQCLTIDTAVPLTWRD